MDRKTLSELYERYGYAVHRRCLRLLGSEAEADDAMQEVFMRAYKYGDSFRGEAPLGWLYRIADRHCFDLLQKRKRFARPEEAEAALDARAREAAPASSPERVQLVARVLSACKPGVQDVAVLYYVDEMTQDEVAAAVGVSRKTVKERLAKFLSTARTMLQPAPSAVGDET